MAIKDLTDVVAPPTTVLETGDIERWKQIEKDLGTLLPKDYFQYATTFGSGSFEDVGKLRITPYNPFSIAYDTNIKMHGTILEAFKAGEGDDYIPFHIFPQSPGLLAWGTDDNGNELYWLTSEDPSNWRVVVRTPENAFEEFNEQITSFLAKLFKREINTSIWSPPFFTNVSNIRFAPQQTAMSAARNIYEIYVHNANKAGFWVTSEHSQKGVSYFIRAINGKSEGPLSGIPNEYGRPIVTGDLYLNGNLFEKDTNLENAYQPIFMLSAPPVGV